jgi:hypothetical protein
MNCGAGTRPRRKSGVSRARPRDPEAAVTAAEAAVAGTPFLMARSFHPGRPSAAEAAAEEEEEAGKARQPRPASRPRTSSSAAGS